MITRHDMMEPLLAALPGFRPQWEAFVAEWRDNPIHEKDDPRDLPNYLVLGDLADALCALMEAGQEDEVAGALAVCERWIVEGDPYVSNAAVAGLLEDLQGAATRRGIDVVRFVPLLGPKGRDWWEMDNRLGAYAIGKAPPQPVFALELPEEVQRAFDERARRAGRVRGTYAREVRLDQIVDDEGK